MAQRVDLGQRKIQSDSEQKEDNAKLCQASDKLGIDDGACGMWSEHNPDQQVAETRRNTQPLKRGYNEHCRAQQQKELSERLICHTTPSNVKRCDWIPAF